MRGNDPGSRRHRAVESICSVAQDKSGGAKGKTMYLRKRMMTKVTQKSTKWAKLYRKVKDGHRRIRASKADDSLLVCTILLTVAKTDDK
jgi:hypothetical protein